MRSKLVHFLLGCLLVLAIGCATTHPRMVSDIATSTSKIRRVLVLVPELDARLKYIGTTHYKRNKANTEKVYSYLLTGVHDQLEQLGYEFYAEHINLEEEVEHSEEMRQFHRKLRQLADSIIDEDLEYYREEIGHKPLQFKIPKALQQFDAVALCYGSAKLETGREYRSRWTKNLFYNIALLPFIFASYVLPFALPFTIGASNLAFQMSPDECFVVVSICDLHDKRIIYQNDYSSRGLIGFGDDEFYSIAACLLEDLPPRNQDP